MPVLTCSANSTVFIYDEKSGETIAKTSVVSVDKINNTIIVDGKYFQSVDNQKVSLLIIDSEAMMECLGVVRRQNLRGNREISIYHTRLKEDRGAIRYKVGAPAAIEYMISGNKTVPASPPIQVMVENVSTSGVLIASTSSRLDVGSAFQLKLKIAGSDLIINTTVMRIVRGEDNQRKLGCSFVSLG